MWRCGHNLTIVSGSRKGGRPKYGCPQNSERGACSNDLREREDWLEERLLADLQSEVLRPEVVDFAVEEFGVQLRGRFSGLSWTLDADRERKASLELELDRLWRLAAQGCAFDSLQAQIAQRERDHREITNRLLSIGPGSVESQLHEIRRFVDKSLTDIRAMLRRDIPTARAEFAKHVKEIRMSPQQVEGIRFYVAEGEWNLLGGYRGSFLENPRPKMTEIDGCGGSQRTEPCTGHSFPFQARARCGVITFTSSNKLSRRGIPGDRFLTSAGRRAVRTLYPC